MTPEDIILMPVLTEKATDGLQPDETGRSDRTSYGKKYAFVVLKTANKTQIKIAVEKMFGVQVKSAAANSREWAATRVTRPPRKRRSSNSRRNPSRSRSSMRFNNGGIEKWQSRDINRHRPRAV